MQNIDLSKLIQIKLDLSVVQDPLALTIQDIYAKITQLESSTHKQVRGSKEISVNCSP